jgi:outer membrane receptor protein involved in Fe transport
MSRISNKNRAHLRRALTCGASAAVLMLWGSPALAQDEIGDETAEENGEETIYVTGSRVRTDGMQAPVPLTVVTADEVEALSPGALISGVSQLPQFYGNQTPNSGAFFTRAGYGALNARGLGVNRTLTLLNGRRMPSTSAFGGVDINLFPEAMIRTVETTTGGASAAYGSDAVAGVVNFILDTNFSGLELSAQGGVTDRGDGDNYELSAAYGMPFAGGRGHVMVSGEYYDQQGIHSYEGRDWYQAWGSLGAGTETNPFRFAPGMVSNNATLDGLISSTNAAINGWRFNPDGTVGPGVTGSISQGAVGTPGARMAGSGIPATPTYQGNETEVNSIYPDLERYSLFAYADFELTDNLMVFAQYLRGRTRIFQYNDPRAAFGVPQTALTIFSGNPFLPANLQAVMTANNIASFSLRRVGSIEDIGQMYLDDTTEQDVATAGFQYEFPGDGFLGGWNVDGYYQYGKSLRTWKQLGLRVDRIFAAVDAVRDASGNIVCNVSRTAGGAAAFPGCQPLNLFGRGNASPAAVDYVVGFEPGQPISTTLFYPSTGLATEPYDYTTSEEKVNLTTFSQHFAELAFSGDIVDLWGAGPIAAALGGSWRKDEIFQRVQDVTNPTSNHVSGRPVMCNNPAINLRGVNAGDCGNTVGNQFSKVSNIRGTAEVWEAFGELLVPIHTSDDFSVVSNAAVRWANYEGSGTIWAYKGGLELGIAGEQIRVRGTYSRDVRAPNLSERFDRTGGFANVTDPRNLNDSNPANDTTTYGVTTASGGNPFVNPEEADTWTVGVVLRPDILPGFSTSIDYYNIEIAGAISTVGTQSVVNRCFRDGAQEFCDLITLADGSTATTNSTATLVGSIVGDLFVNVAAANVEGIDLETSYISDVRLFGGDRESVSLRVLASWLLTRSDTNSSGQVNDFAGSVGALPYADFKATASLNYRNGGFSGLVQARYTDDGYQSSCGVQGNCFTRLFYEDNDVPSVTYIDLRFGYDLEIAGTNVEVSANVTNLFDVDPPITPAYIGLAEHAAQANTSLYDVLGRRYTLGVKVRM